MIVKNCRRRVFDAKLHFVASIIHGYNMTVIVLGIIVDVFSIQGESDFIT